MGKQDLAGAGASNHRQSRCPASPASTPVGEGASTGPESPDPRESVLNSPPSLLLLPSSNSELPEHLSLRLSKLRTPPLPPSHGMAQDRALQRPQCLVIDDYTNQLNPDNITSLGQALIFARRLLPREAEAAMWQGEDILLLLCLRLSEFPASGNHGNHQH